MTDDDDDRYAEECRKCEGTGYLTDDWDSEEECDWCDGTGETEED